MSADTALGNLTDSQKQLLENRLAQFEQAWDEKSLAAQLRTLPSTGDPVRALLLIGLAQADLRQRWRRGQRATVEAYLKACPELGDSPTAPMALILAEYEARQEAGLPVKLTDFEARFPSRADELRQRLEGTCLVAPGTSSELADKTEAQAASLKPRDGSRSQNLSEQFGRYRILRLLGKGGMGSVYLAQDTQLDRRIALKVPHFSATDGPEARERFLREARTAATLDHPNICQIFDMGQVDGVYYLTMAFVEGRPLSALVAQGPLPLRQAAILIRKLALGLAEAHARKIIHRDLKPSNIMMNTRGEPILMDFGLARRINHDEERLTQSGVVLGTPAYMSPEQVCGEVAAYGPQTDVYSLGAVLYELLTGQPPFVGQFTKVLVHVLEHEPPPPSSLRLDLDAALEGICLRAMSKKPEGRFAGMKEFAAALTSYLKGEMAMDNPAPQVQILEEVPDDRTVTARRKESEQKTRRSTVRQEAEEEPVVSVRPSARHGRRKRRKRSGISVGLWIGLGCCGLALLVLLIVGQRMWKRWSSGADTNASATAPEVKPEPTTNIPPPKPAAGKLPNGWREFKPSGGGFSVGLPGQPAFSQVPIKGVVKATLLQYSIREGTATYSVGYTDTVGVALTEKEVAFSLEETADALLKQADNSQLVSKKQITLDGHPGTEVVYDLDLTARRYRAISRFYASGSRMYVVMTRAMLADYPTERIEAFFNSFVILP